MMSSNATHITPNIGRTSHRATRDFSGQDKQQFPPPLPPVQISQNVWFAAQIL